MKQIFVDGVYEHDYEFKDNIHYLYYSSGEQWTSHIRGTLALSIEDTGNELKVKLGNKINYSKAVYLTILLKIIHKDYKFEISDKIEF